MGGWGIGVLQGDGGQSIKERFDLRSEGRVYRVDLRVEGLVAL